MLANIVSVIAIARASGDPVINFNCSSQPAGTFDRITLKNEHGMQASFIRYGATITNLIFPDRHGLPRDVVLGFDNTIDYCSFGGPVPNHPYFGATIGRVANRISNGTVPIDGKVYHTPLNDHDYDTLHGGWVGFDRRVWSVVDQTDASVTFSYTTFDGEEGFPGEIEINVTHAITDNDEWQISYSAKAGETDTVLAMTNHAYFNLNANVNDTTTVLEHVLTLPNVDTFVEVDPVHLCPTGKIGSVNDATFLDFRKPKAVGKDIDEGNASPKGGYDDAFIFSNWERGVLRTGLAIVESALTGIKMEMATDLPSVQIYTGNFLNSTGPTKIPRKKSQTQGPNTEYYHWRGAITFEAQFYPDTPNHPNFPSIELKKHGIYKSKSIYKLSNF